MTEPKKVLIVGGSSEERVKAIAKLKAEGAIVVEEEDIPNILQDTVLSDDLLKEFAITTMEFPDSPELLAVDYRKVKKKKGKKGKFNRQPWQ